MTAEALKTITAPIMHSARVARNNQRSVWRLRGTFNSPGWLARFPEASGMLQIPHQLLEEAAAVLIVLKLVEAGARRCQQHHVARQGALTRQAHRPVQRPRATQPPRPPRRFRGYARRATRSPRDAAGQSLRRCGGTRSGCRAERLRWRRAWTG